MNILISGASGLIGRELTRHLKSQGHSVFTLSRKSRESALWWKPEDGSIHIPDQIHVDAAICLNGVNIGDKRWSKARKRAIVESRVNSTSLLAETLAKRTMPPKVFLAASAIGFYGDTGGKMCDEASPAGQGFLTEIVQRWELASEAAIQAGIRTVSLRSGVVLTKDGGALAKMLLPFKMGLGGRVGSGKQFMSWISIEDEIRAIDFILNHPDITGPVNLTAPNPVTNAEFTKALANALSRPAIFPMPAFVVKTLFGEMGELLLLGSNRIKSQVLQRFGFEFKHPTIEQALVDVLSA